jgi:spore germination cell wall hydrolase CwlJ-like protein
MDIFQTMIGVATIRMEAGGEPYAGKLGVAYTLVNRMKWRNQSLSDVCFAPWQFSCWNTDAPTRMNLDTIKDNEFAECLKALIAAYFDLEPDPTSGAVFYLNKAIVLKTAGKLPDWWFVDGDESTEILIGAHSFRKHK